MRGVYSQMPRVKVMGVHDMDTETAEAVADEFALPVAKTLLELLEHVDAVTIAAADQRAFVPGRRASAYRGGSPA